MLNAPLLAQHHCWFGGGTAIVLANGEFRESVDIDFLASDPKSYRAAPDGQGPRARRSGYTRTGRGSKTPVDGYGIGPRCSLRGLRSEFEIIHEGRRPRPPAPDEEICGLRTLTRTDQVATKLLADDRWADVDVQPRPHRPSHDETRHGRPRGRRARQSMRMAGRSASLNRQSPTSEIARNVSTTTSAHSRSTRAPSGCLAKHPRPVRKIREVEGLSRGSD